MKKKKEIIITVILLILFVIFLKIVVQKEKNIEYNYDQENIHDNTNETNEYNNKDNNEIETIKKEINATADSDIYKIEEETGGRKILQIKPEVQFNVVLAGILKNNKPEENEIEELIKKAPKDKGIWISKQSKENFMKLLSENNIKNFNINDKGYLKFEKNNENNEKDIEKGLVNMINSNKLYIISMTGISYQRDYISGQIEEYPFEDMDPTQILEQYEENDKIILEITSNKNKKLTDEEILDTIVKY